MTLHKTHETKIKYVSLYMSLYLTTFCYVKLYYKYRKYRILLNPTYIYAGSIFIYIDP